MATIQLNTDRNLLRDDRPRYGLPVQKPVVTTMGTGAAAATSTGAATGTSGYDKNVDYQALINQAVAAGDYKAAGRYEQLRNAKIAGEGITDYQQTHNFGSIYDQQYFTNDELGKAYEQRMAAQSGATGWDSAHSYVEQKRNGYGYSGGADGSQYIPLSTQAGSSQTPYQSAIDKVLGQMNSYGAFSYDAPAPTYQSPYQATLDSLLGQLLDRQEFSYDMGQDPNWSAYKKQYRREGDRATASALAQASAATGGMPSSYAQTAAGQAGDYYATKLTDMIPTLYQQAYDRYLNEYQMKQSDLAAVNTQEQNAYQRYLNDLGQWNTDREFAYSDYLNGFNRLQSQLAAYQGQDDTLWQRALTEEQMRQAAQQQAWNNNMSLWETLGYAPQSVADALGIGTGARTAEWDSTLWQRALTEEQMRQAAQQQAWNNNMSLWETLGYAPQGVADALGIGAGAKTSGQTYTDWNMSRTDAQDAQSAQQQIYNNAMDLWAALGYANQAVSDALGVPVGTPTSDQRYRDLAQAAGSGGSSGSGRSYSSGGSGSGSSSGAASAAQLSDSGIDPYEALYAAALTSSNPQNYISSHYKEYGFTTVSGLYDGYKKWQATGDKLAPQLTTENYGLMKKYVKKLYEDVARSGGGYDETLAMLDKMGWSRALSNQIFYDLGL